MCYGCYREYGEPQIFTDQTVAAAKLVNQLYEIAPAGGHAHIVVDDWNLEDELVAWCIDSAEHDEYGHGEYQCAVEIACLKALAALPLPERASAMAIHEGWLTKHGLIA